MTERQAADGLIDAYGAGNMTSGTPAKTVRDYDVTLAAFEHPVPSHGGGG